MLQSLTPFLKSVVWWKSRLGQRKPSSCRLLLSAPSQHSQVGLRDALLLCARPPASSASSYPRI